MVSCKNPINPNPPKPQTPHKPQNLKIKYIGYRENIFLVPASINFICIDHSLIENSITLQDQKRNNQINKIRSANQIKYPQPSGCHLILSDSLLAFINQRTKQHTSYENQVDEHYRPGSRCYIFIIGSCQIIKMI